jgi:phosphatidylglycerol:prolipoprotein diacylglycerol transferase
MIAFTILGRPVYRYGIFYAITFAFGYFFFWLLIKRKTLAGRYPHLHTFVTHHSDDLIVAVMLGVLLGWRLGHVFLYERSYYQQHLLEILHVWQGGMSFVGWFIGVVIALIRSMRKRKLSRQEMLILGECVLCVVPLGSLLGRIGNFLNQELVWRTVAGLSTYWQDVVHARGLGVLYPQVDMLPRINVNLLQAAGEWLILWISMLLLFNYVYVQKKSHPWLMAGIYCLGYALIRFVLERAKELPANEMIWWLSVSQWLMVAMAGVGVWILHKRMRSL